MHNVFCTSSLVWVPPQLMIVLLLNKNDSHLPLMEGIANVRTFSNSTGFWVWNLNVWFSSITQTEMYKSYIGWFKAISSKSLDKQGPNKNCFQHVLCLTWNVTFMRLQALCWHTWKNAMVTTMFWQSLYIKKKNAFVDVTSSNKWCKVMTLPTIGVRSAP